MVESNVLHTLIESSRYIFTLEGKDMKISASDPQPVHIPAKARHTFKVDDTHEGVAKCELQKSRGRRSECTVVRCMLSRILAQC